MNPLQLDYIINGAKVFLYEGSDGAPYASLDDFSRFGVAALDTVRVKLDANSTVKSVLNDPKVRKRISALTPHHEGTP